MVTRGVFLFIQVRSLSHIYAPAGSDPVHALDGITFSVEHGEYIAIVGANGSGKTTLARHLNGLLLPSDGEVLVNGLKTTDESATRSIRSAVGMVFQSPDDQLVATIVREDVAFGPENLGVAEDKLPGIVEESLKRVGMWEERLRPPHQLSAGQKQRVALAGILAMSPRCLVLDEATAMLDPVGSQEVLSIVDDLHREGMTVIAVTHKMDEAVRADRILVMHAGRLEADGKPKEIFSHPDLNRWKLKRPAASILAEHLRRRLPDFADDIFDLQSLVSAISQRQPV
jgi:energy-coupling factor transporter ATPase